MQKYGLAEQGVKAGGYDLLPTTLKLITERHLDFTIDQQPYLQGFYPVMQLFLHKCSGGLVAPSDTNTGLLFVTKANVKPYLTTKTRYHGSSKQAEVPGHAAQAKWPQAATDAPPQQRTRRLRPARRGCVRPPPRGEHPLVAIVLVIYFSLAPTRSTRATTQAIAERWRRSRSSRPAR